MATTREPLIRSRALRRLFCALGLVPLAWAAVAMAGMWMRWPGFEQGVGPGFLALAMPFLLPVLLASSTRRVAQPAA